jgi:hypothetical protein
LNLNIMEPDGYLSTRPAPGGSELEQWRVVQSVLDALRDNPEAFSRKETIQAHIDKYVALAGIYGQHSVPTGLQLEINAASGAYFALPLVEIDAILEDAE